MKVKGLPGPNKTYLDSASCPHIRPHTLPDLDKTSPPPCRRTPVHRARPRRRPAIWPPRVCPIATSPDAGRTTRDTGRRPNTWACSATGACSPTPVPPPQLAPPTAGTCSRPVPDPPLPNSGAPPHKVPAPPSCQVPLNRAPR
jgi:hypothetical protein